MLESRKANYINMGLQQTEYVSSIIIDTKELELPCVPLDEILKTESIKTNSLIVYSIGDLYDDDFSTMNIRFNFHFYLLSINILQLQFRISRKVKTKH